MPEKIKTLYSNLVKEGYDLPNYDQFILDMSDNTKRQRFHSSLVEEGYDLPDFNTFTVDMGFTEKKKPSQDFPTLQDAFGVSLRGPQIPKSSRLISTSPSTGKPSPSLPSGAKQGKQTLTGVNNSIQTKINDYNSLNKELESFASQLEKSKKELDRTDKKAVDAFNKQVGLFNEKYKKVQSISSELKGLEKSKTNLENALMSEGIKSASGILNKLNTYQATLGQVSQRYKANRQAAMKAEQMGDIEAAKEIYPLIEKDRQAIGTLTELIKNGREIARTQEPDTILNNADIGFNTALGTLLQAPEGATAASAAIVKDVLDKLDVPKKEVLKRTIDFMSKDANVSHYIGEVGRLLTKSSEDRTEIIKSGRDYNGSAWTALKKGDIGKAANYGFKDFVNSLPSSMAYMSGIGAAAMSGGAVANELGGMEDRGEEVTALKTYGAIIKSALEVATERMFGAGKAGKELIQKLGKPAAEKAVKEATEALVKKSLGRKAAGQYGEEVFGEGVNTIGSNAVHIYLYGDKNKGLFDGIGDTFLQSIISSTVQGVPATVINHRIDSKRIAEANAMKEQAVKLTEQAMEQPTEAAAQALEEKALELNKQAEDIITEERDMALNLSQETLDYLDMYDQQVEELLAAKEGVDAETAAIFDEKIEALEKEREQAVEGAKKEAKQNAKEEIKLAKEAEQEDADMLRAAKVEEPVVEKVKENVSLTDKGKESEIPEIQVEKPSETPALKDVESTAKALGEKDENDLSRIFNKNAAEKLASDINKDIGVDLFIARKPIEKNGERFVISQIKENNNDRTFIIEDESGNEIGRAQLSGDGNYIENIRIDEKHRRKGLATEIYNFIETRKSVELIPSPIKQSKEAKALWEKRAIQKSVSKNVNAGVLAKSLKEAFVKTFYPQQISEAYHKAKQDGSNPELVKAVEELLTPKENAIQEQEASSVPIQPKAEGSQEVQGTQPESGPKEVADKGEKEKVEEISKSVSTSPKNIRDLYTTNRTLFGLNRVQSFASAVAMDRMVGVMAKRAGISKSDMYGRLKFEKASEEFVKGLSDRAKVLWQIVGENANLAQDVRDNLQVARDMETAGKDAKTIRLATGWEKGKDNKWRYEIFTNPPFKVKLNLKFNQPKVELTNDKEATHHSQKLGDIINFPQLFEAYPKLKNLQVDLYLGGIDGVQGSYSSAGKYMLGIELFAENEKIALSGLLHEIQHAIQDIEGFAKGTYGVSMQEEIAAEKEIILLDDKISISIQIIRDANDSFISENIDELSDIQKNAYQEILDYSKSANMPILDAAKVKDKIWKKDKDTQQGILKQNEKYRKTAGEVEARNVQTRMGMTPEQRRETLLLETEDVARDEQIVLFQKSDGKARGAVMVTLDGQAVIYALTDPNVSTPLHELAHVFEHYLTDTEKAIVQNWAKTKGWNIETSEAFARGFEKYLLEGKSPIPALQKIFEKFKDWLTDIYNGIVGSDIDIELNDSMREIYSQMLGKEIKPSKKEVLIPKEFKPSVESRKAAKAFVDLSNSEASAPSIKERKQAKIQEAIEEVRKADPAKADKMQEVFDRMPEIQQTLLEKGIIKAIDCKWG